MNEILNFEKLESYDSKIKDYIKKLVLDRYPSGSILKLDLAIHPHYLYGGSWKKLDNSAYFGAFSENPNYDHADIYTNLDYDGAPTVGQIYSNDNLELSMSVWPHHTHTYGYQSFKTRDANSGGWFSSTDALTCTSGSSPTVDKNGNAETNGKSNITLTPPYLTVAVWERVESGGTSTDGYSKPENALFD